VFVACTARYKVTVVTGVRHAWTGTDAYVYIKLFGDDSNCGEIELNDPNDNNDFEGGE